VARIIAAYVNFVSSAPVQYRHPCPWRSEKPFARTGEPWDPGISYRTLLRGEQGCPYFGNDVYPRAFYAGIARKARFLSAHFERRMRFATSSNRASQYSPSGRAVRASCPRPATASRRPFAARRDSDSPHGISGPSTLASVAASVWQIAAAVRSCPHAPHFKTRGY
jgi:hypothetical protein